MVVMELFNFNYRKKLTLGYRGILQLYQHALLSPGWGGGGGEGAWRGHEGHFLPPPLRLLSNLFPRVFSYS